MNAPVGDRSFEIGLTTEDRRFSITLPQPAGGDAVYCLAPHKAGSVLFDALARAIARWSGRPFAPVEGLLFENGAAPWQCGDDLLAVYDQPGYVFTGIRELWRLPELARFRGSLKLVLVRDPRDMVVSLYHSIARSHAVPSSGTLADHMQADRKAAQSLGASEFVLNGKADWLAQNYTLLADAVSDPALGVWHWFRYEDIIYAKRDWARALAAIVGAQVIDAEMEQLLAQQDVFPTDEQPGQHVRRVHPGGYARDLSPDAIRYLERIMRRPMEVFGYQAWAG